MTEKTGTYKYCLVPRCTNTSKSTPDKYFFPVPRHKDLRIKWCTAMKRIGMMPLSYKTSLHCCQDHFDLEYDVRNYVRYQLAGGRMMLKCGVLPHRFDCYNKKNFGQNQNGVPFNKIEHLVVVSCYLDDIEVCDIKKYEIQSSRGFL